MTGFKTTLDIQVRFRDTDAMGHINNAVYLSYLELARMEYIRQVSGITDFRGVEFILARVEIDYRSPGFVGETLVAGVRVAHIGGASFEMVYRIEDRATGRLVAEARTVQVGFDYKAGRVRRVSAQFKELVGRHDGVS